MLNVELCWVIRNWHNHKARALKVTILRKLNRIDDAKDLIKESLKIDTFNFGCLFEEYLLSTDITRFLKLIRNESHNFEEIALDYCAAGCWEEASKLLKISVNNSSISALTLYYLGYCLWEGKLPGYDVVFHGPAKTDSQ